MSALYRQSGRSAPLGEDDFCACGIGRAGLAAFRQSPGRFPFLDGWDKPEWCGECRPESGIKDYAGWVAGDAAITAPFRVEWPG